MLPSGGGSKVFAAANILDARRRAAPLRRDWSHSTLSPKQSVLRARLDKGHPLQCGPLQRFNITAILCGHRQQSGCQPQRGGLYFGWNHVAAGEIGIDRQQEYAGSIASDFEGSMKAIADLEAMAAALDVLKQHRSRIIR